MKKLPTLCNESSFIVQFDNSQFQRCGNFVVNDKDHRNFLTPCKHASMWSTEYQMTVSCPAKDSRNCTLLY